MAVYPSCFSIKGRLHDLSTSFRNAPRWAVVAVNVDITLHAGDRVGVVGRNGVGKSSLFAAIQGELEADKGNVELPGKLRIASVAQETPSLSDLALDFVLSGDDVVAEVLRVEAEANAREDWEAVAAAHQRLAEIGGYDAEARAGKLLHGLGFLTQTQRRAVSTFWWLARPLEPGTCTDDAQ